MRYNDMLTIRHTKGIRQAKGFTLIELMLAMVIGLIIMGGVMQVYLSTRDTQRSSEDQLDLLADARFAMETIAYDLRHTGIWGRHNLWDMITCHEDSEFPCEKAPGSEYVMPLAAGDCSDYDYINYRQPILAHDNFNGYAGSCIPLGYVANTDIVGIRYADTNKISTDSLAPGVVYIRSNVKKGQLFIGDILPDPIFSNAAKGSVPPTDWWDEDVSSNHLAISRTYYLSDHTDQPGDGLPSLRRLELVEGPALEDQVLIPGVEDFQIEFGIDTGTNGSADGVRDNQVDTYVNASNVTLAGSWCDGSIIAAKIWVLVRSSRADRNKIGGDGGAGQEFTIAGTKVIKPNDGYQRFLLSTVVKLRNTFQIDKNESAVANACPPPPIP